MQPTEPESREHPTEEAPVRSDLRVGARIAQARREAGLSQRALADHIDVRLWTVDQWESGTGAVSPTQLEQMAEVTHRSPAWFLTGTEDQPTEQRADEQGADDPAAEAVDAEPELAGLDDSALGEDLEETRRETDEPLPEAERQLLELERRRQELAERERSQADEAAVVAKVLISAQRAADLLQADAEQEAEERVAAARKEAKAIVAKARRTRELADRDRAEAADLLMQIRVALGETAARWNSLAPGALDVDRKRREQDRDAGNVIEQTDDANGRGADLVEDLRFRSGDCRPAAEEVVSSDD